MKNTLFLTFQCFFQVNQKTEARHILTLVHKHFCTRLCKSDMPQVHMSSDINYLLKMSLSLYFLVKLVYFLVRIGIMWIPFFFLMNSLLVLIMKNNHLFNNSLLNSLTNITECSGELRYISFSSFSQKVI